MSNIIGTKNIEVNDKRHFLFFFSKSHTPINQKGHENLINYPPKGIINDGGRGSVWCACVSQHGLLHIVNTVSRLFLAFECSLCVGA